MGGAATGGAEALLSGLNGLAAPGGDGLASRRLEVKVGYGLSAFGNQFPLTPEAGAGLSESGRDVSLGVRLTRPVDAGSFELALEASRREDADSASGFEAGSPPEHAVGLRLTTSW